VGRQIKSRIDFTVQFVLVMPSGDIWDTMPDIIIKPLTNSPQTRAALSEILVEVVANGGSVNFMHPLDIAVADAFWETALTATERGERIVLGAFDGEVLISTVTLQLQVPPNQPHRAEIAKMITRVNHRGRGAAKALLQTAERLAIEHNKTLLVLDTAAEDGAAKLYEAKGFTLAGIIPDYALKPHGGLTAAMFYWKRIGKGI
jgi:ribosomal protein S18 acetylase RimI-like enzyme